MSEERNQKQKTENTEKPKEFITQRITGRKDRGQKLVKLFLKTAFVAVVFTAAVMLTAGFLMTRLHWKIPAVQNPTAETVHIERDEAAAETSLSAEESYAAQTSGEPVGETRSPAATQPPVSRNESGKTSGTGKLEAGASEMEHHAPLGMEDLLELTGSLQEAVNVADRSVASVTHLKEGKDWFDNALKTEGVYSGVVVAKTDLELLLLTTTEAVNGADALTVRFQRGDEMNAVIKRQDIPTGLAVLSLPITDENRELLGTIEALPLGNSYRLRRGDLVMAVGAPLGIVHSSDYGIVSDISNGVNVTDGLASLIYVDCAGSASSGTWILNSEGELIGWATDALADDRIPHTALLGISDFKDVLERMINGQASPYLGIKGTAVRSEQEAQGIPAGIYIMEEKRNSPAYEAGIQPGDIISEIGRQKITSMREYTAALEKTGAEDIVTIKVMRNGRDSYMPISFQVKVGAR